MLKGKEIPLKHSILKLHQLNDGKALQLCVQLHLPTFSKGAECKEHNNFSNFQTGAHENKKTNIERKCNFKPNVIERDHEVMHLNIPKGIQKFMRLNPRHMIPLMEEAEG